jgi:hypothetical protein
MTIAETMNSSLLKLAISYCAAARWHSLSQLTVLQDTPDSEPLARELPLVRFIQQLAHRHTSEETSGEILPTFLLEAPATSLMLVGIAFQHLQLAEQHILLGEIGGARMNSQMFVHSLLSAAVECCGRSFTKVEEEQIRRASTILPQILESQLELRMAITSGSLPANMLLVLGMHRSGTSAVSGLLSQSGFDPPSDLMPAGPNNPLGYWESIGLCILNDRLFMELGSSWSNPEKLPVNWEETPEVVQWRKDVLEHLQNVFAESRLPVIKDPRLCILSKGLSPWLESNLVRWNILLIMRNPLEVAQSLAKAEKISKESAMRLWLHYLFSAEQISRQHPRLVVTFEEVIMDPRLCLDQCLELVGADSTTLKSDEGLAFVTSDLYREKSTEIKKDVSGYSITTDTVRRLAMTVYKLITTTRLADAQTELLLDSLACHWWLVSA